MANKPSSKVRLALAGLSHDHVFWILRKLQRPDLEVAAFYEPDRALAESYAARIGFSRDLIYTSLPEMLDAVKPEAVAAFGSIFDHLSVVEACAPRGIHVMVEKPLAVNMQHAARMAELARAHRIHLITNFETTWYASTYAAYDLAVTQGAYGPIRKVVVHDGHQGPAELGCTPAFLSHLTDPVLNGGGAVVDFGCYGASLITWLLGGQLPLTVTARLQTLKPDVYPKVDDEANILLTYPAAAGIIQGSWNWPVGRKDMEIYGRDGYVVAVDDRHLRLRARGEKRERRQTLAPAPQRVRDPFAYLSAVVRGKETVQPGNLWSLENNLAVVRILDAARESARTGCAVAL